jgi:hypothetical protein
MEKYRGVEVYLHLSLTSALDGDERLASCSAHFTPGERAPVLVEVVCYNVLKLQYFSRILIITTIMMPPSSEIFRQSLEDVNIDNDNKNSTSGNNNSSNVGDGEQQQQEEE